MQTLNNNFKHAMSEQDFRRFKKWLKNHLAFGPVTVIFNKKDGTERTMLCTTNHEIVPYVESTDSKKERKVNEETCAVYDIEAKGWRSFRWDSIKTVRFDLGG